MYKEVCIATKLAIRYAFSGKYSYMSYKNTEMYNKDTIQAMMSLILAASLFRVPNYLFNVTNLICFHFLIAMNSLSLAAFHQFITLYMKTAKFKLFIAIRE